MTSSPQMFELDWEEQFEPLFGSPITIPQNTLLWRGYDTRYDPISERYSYYSSMNIALDYANQPFRELGCFITRRPLKILDIRFMKQILARIIQLNKADPYITDFASAILSFGICSLGHQIKLVKMRYSNLIKMNTPDSKIIKQGINKIVEGYEPNAIIEQEGVRIAETTNDGTTMAFLQEIFGNFFNGFISPRIATPFHDEKRGQLHPELILFNPKGCAIRQIYTYPSNIIVRPISTLISDKHQLVNLDARKDDARIQMKMYMSGGSGSGSSGNSSDIKTHYLDEYENKLNSNDKQTVKLYTNAVRAGKRWNRKLYISHPNGIVPTVPVTIFTSPTF